MVVTVNATKKGFHMYPSFLQQPEGSSVVEKTSAGQGKIPAESSEAQKTASSGPTESGNETKVIQHERELLEQRYPVGTIVWGKLPGYDWWPGILLSYDDRNNGIKKESEETSDDEENGGNVGVRVWVKWYGDNQLSQVRAS